MNLARSTFYNEPASQSFGDAKIVEKIGEICADYPRYGLCLWCKLRQARPPHPCPQEVGKQCHCCRLCERECHLAAMKPQRIENRDCYPAK